MRVCLHKTLAVGSVLASFPYFELITFTIDEKCKYQSIFFDAQNKTNVLFCDLKGRKMTAAIKNSILYLEGAVTLSNMNVHKTRYIRFLTP